MSALIYRQLHFLSAILIFSFHFSSIVVAAEESQRWPEIKNALFGERTIGDAAGLLQIEAPDRAYDSALVPIDLEALAPQSIDRYIAKIYLVVDNNPAPLAGTFEFNPNHGWANLQTRIRINEYTDVRAIAETNNGELFMTQTYVKAAGGCSAPALSDQEAALQRVGRMKLNMDEIINPFQPNVAQILVSHPNNSGMQFDQISRNYIPAYFVRKIGVRFNDEELLTVDTNFSLSEDPSIHFTFIPRENGTISVYAEDSRNERYENSWPVKLAQPEI